MVAEWAGGSKTRRNGTLINADKRLFFKLRQPHAIAGAEAARLVREALAG
jgi:hypothetical protein